ncbi:hypothetical protein XENTR_v10001113 [Xenopus tropicalis]|uniref:Starch-binding domain-containing protein 1 n=1 Tax=Xenopus tropicalis TaxID=8364 RepID=A0A6I8SS44_XENTR|nr:starch-binding domain-containing protein 1 [Xenopus tropicalis]KAE8631224.1 hypothetical protein XENTR_v10001113 [Xenopus tropicalis]|eukprot:XP_002938156.1 PREDICTED: starch-binding domain-containing protein 1 [Xenopus tropicalis]
MVKAEKPQSPVGGKQDAMPEVSNNMWVALVLGVLSAIFAWIWFGGTKDEKSEPQTEGEKVAVDEAAAQQAFCSFQQEDGGMGQAKVSELITVGTEVHSVEPARGPKHSLERESQQVSENDAAYLHVFEDKTESEKPISKVVLEPILKMKEQSMESLNPCQKVASQVFCTIENGAPSAHKQFALAENDSLKPLVTEVGEEELFHLPECVYSLLGMPCKDQVIECDLSPRVKTFGAVKEQKDAFLAHSSTVLEGANYNAILLPQSHTEAEHIYLPLSDLNGEKCEPLHSPEKIELVSATMSDVKLPNTDHTKIKRVAAVQPMPHNIKVDFKVHYITHSETQWLAVTGNHEKLGGWETFVPLKSEKDGFWSHSVILPADTIVEWKFVMVENGKIKRWEECSNRSLTTGHDDVEVHEWWGYL